MAATAPKRHILLLKPPDSELTLVQQILARYDYSVTLAKSIPDALEKLQECEASPEVIILGTQLWDGTSAVAICIQIRSDSTLSPVPVLVLSTSKEAMIVQAIFGAGADVVLYSPFEAELIHHQISALCRQRTHFKEQLAAARDVVSLGSPLVRALDCAREGIILFSKAGEILHLNRSANKLLGLNQHSNDDMRQAVCGRLFQTIALPQGSGSDQSQSGHDITLDRYTIKRADKQSLDAVVRVILIRGERDSTIIYAVGINDATELTHLSNLLLQSQRQRSLALLCAAYSLSFLRASSAKIQVNWLSYIAGKLKDEPLTSNLEEVLTALLEAVDLVLSTGSQINVQPGQGGVVAVKNSDLFQLFGHILLFAVEQGGVGSEITVTIEPPSESYLSIVVQAERRRATSFLREDFLAELIQGKLFRTEDSTGKLSYGLEAAQKIAQRYKTNLEFKDSKEGVKLRVNLPR